MSLFFWFQNSSRVLFVLSTVTLNLFRKFIFCSDVTFEKKLTFYIYLTS
jgi:hypothetical protein